MPPDGERLPALEPGDPRTIGRFVVTGRLGAGAMGVVYAAHDPQLDRKVAVKLLRSEESERSGAWQGRLLREAQALAKLSHPNVVQIHEVGPHEDGVFLAMEYVTGLTLRAWLSEQPRSWRQIADVFAEAGRGLAAAHAAGLVHRDVKPENFLVGADGRVRVVDFGLVRFDDESDPGQPSVQLPAHTSATRTAPGILVGTPAYMSPEQYRGRPADALSDQFSFCVALFEALYGERPFAGATAQEVSRSVLSGQIALRPGERHVPTWLARAILRGLHADRSARWPDMRALVAELARDRGRSRRVALWSALLLMTSGLLFAGVSWVGSHRARLARERAEEFAAGRLLAARANIDELLAEGRRDEAAAVFDAFVAVPEHRGTAAFARAHQLWGERMNDLGDLPAARVAFAQAYAAAEDPATERAVLDQLAALFHAQWAWDPLASLCAVVGPAAPGDPREARCAEAALARRDLVSPLPPALAGVAPIVTLWSHATRTERSADVAGPAGRELFLYNRQNDRLDFVRPDLALTPLRRYTASNRLADRPGLLPLTLEPEGPPLVFTWSPNQRRVALSAAGGGALDELLGLPADEPLAAIAADLDRDGRGEIYLGTGPFGRTLLALHPQPAGAWRVDHPHPRTDATNSDINALLAADLDRDGRDELVVAAGAWRAFDVRVLRPAASGPFELLARRKLGDVAALAALRGPAGETLLVAAKTDAYPSKLAFPAGAPAGEPAGLYLLRLRGRDLETVRFLPAPRRAGASRPVDFIRLLVGDIDGDGLDDLVAAARDPEPSAPVTSLFRQLPDGDFARATLGGLIPQALVDVDDDPALELLATPTGTGESSLWLLGAGAAPLSPLPSAHAAPAEPAAALDDPILVRAWRRAEQLAALGLASDAARALDDLGRFLSQPPARAAALLRAAELHEAAGEFLTAAERYEQAADTAGTPALQGAARCYEQADRFADALRVHRALAERGDLPRAEVLRVHARLPQLAAIVDDVALADLRFTAPLGPPWRVDDPLAARQDLASQHLHLDAFAGHGAIVRVPLEWSSGPLGAAIDLDVQRAEWGSGLLLGVRTPGSASLLFSVGLEVVGGGGLYTRRAVCSPPGGRDVHVLAEEPGEDPARAGRLGLEIEVLPDLGLVTCTARPLAGPDAKDGAAGPPRTRRFPLPSDALPAPGRYELVLLPRAFTEPSGLWFGADLRSVTIRGARPLTAPDLDPSRGLAARLLAQGDHDAGLTELGRWPALDPLALVWRGLALSELGRWPEASDALRPLADAAPEVRGAIARLLRTRGQTFAPLVRSALGPRYFRLAWEAIERAVTQHPGDPLLDRTLTAALSDLDDYQPDPADLAIKVRLLLERGRAWARLGQAPRARADLDRAAELRAGLPAGAPDFADIDLERAALALAAGSRTAAFAHARAALERAPARELLADRLRADPRFADLDGDPVWRTLLAD